MEIKLHNNLPNHLKNLDNIQLFRKKLNFFNCNAPILYRNIFLMNIVNGKCKCMWQWLILKNGSLCKFIELKDVEALHGVSWWQLQLFIWIVAYVLRLLMCPIQFLSKRMTKNMIISNKICKWQMSSEMPNGHGE